ncbi:MAG: hypothetical protein WCL00_00160 [Bacteroidota bacterium]
MKKYILSLIAFLLISSASFSQKVTMANYTDTLSAASTKYYPATIQADLWYGGFQIYVDHLTGTTDSTHVWIQGSVDGSNYVNMGSVTVSARSATANGISVNSWDIVCFYTTDATYVWYFTTPMVLPYYRFAVQHYVAASTVRVKGYLTKKK